MLAQVLASLPVEETAVEPTAFSNPLFIIFSMSSGARGVNSGKALTGENQTDDEQG